MTTDQRGSSSRFHPFEDILQREGAQFVIGIDEAGRGPLAGPVVAAAVSLKEGEFTARIADSKVLSPRQREKAFEEIMAVADVGVGMMSEGVIDAVNIRQATFLAMSNAVRDLIARSAHFTRHPEIGKRTCLLVDGNDFESDLPYRVRTIVGGDRLCRSIACASIVAKVIRDRILHIYDRTFPQYGFSSHKGYPTLEHKAAIREHGLSVIHRKSFRSV